MHRVHHANAPDHLNEVNESIRPRQEAARRPAAPC